MGPFQIIFLLLNLAIPAYFLTRTSDVAPKTEWTVWEHAMARLIDSDGGFPGCSTLDVVSTIEDLCVQSQSKSSENKNGNLVERSSPQVTFSCLYDEKSIQVTWRLQEKKDGDLECRDPGGAIVPLSPGFTFAHDGRMRSMEFTAQNGQRQKMPAINCRAKVARAKTLTPVNDLDHFLTQLGRTTNDPADTFDGNFMCFVFDFSPLWQPWRKKYQR